MTIRDQDGATILLVSSNFPPVVGGSAVVYDQLCRALAPRVVALSARQRIDATLPQPDPAAKDAGLPYRMYRIDRLRPAHDAAAPGQIPAGPLRRLASVLSDDLPIMARTLAAILTLILKHRIRTVCIGELVTLGWLVFPLRYVFGRRVIIYTHGEEILQENPTLQGRLRRSYLSHASAIVSVSLFCRGTIVSKYGIDPARVFVVPNGVDLSSFHRGGDGEAPIPADFRGKRLILSVSRLVSRKGQDRLIAALPAILMQQPDVRCLIVGDGPERAGLEAEAAAHGVADLVAFLGSVPLGQLQPLYRAAELFALPCRTLDDGDTEGFGLVFLEANACGLPVVAGAAGGTVEAVIDDETGLVVDGHDTAEIARAILAILGDQARAARYAEAGWRRAQDCGWPRVAAAFLAVCEGSPPVERVAMPATPIAASGFEVVAAPRLLVTVDVEEEFDWTRFARADYRVRGFAALEDFHARCVALGVSPVLLATYPMLQDPLYRAFFRRVQREGSAEIGIHLHGWTAPPHWEHVSVYNSYQCNLPRHVERRKLESLKRLYEEALGTKPRIHRAGRWGAGAQTFSIIEELGIEVDLSLSAGFSDAGHGGPDFTGLDGSPLRVGDHGSMLSVPASSVQYLRGPDWVSTTYFRHRRTRPALSRLVGALLSSQPVRFSPEGVTQGFLEAMARELAVRRLPVAVFTLHSTSLYAGGSPYAPDEAAAAALAARALSGIRYCIEALGFEATRCADLYQAAALGAPPPRPIPAGARQAIPA